VSRRKCERMTGPQPADALRIGATPFPKRFPLFAPPALLLLAALMTLAGPLISTALSATAAPFGTSAAANTAGPFDVDAALTYTAQLTDGIGIRRAGAEGESRAGDWLVDRLSALGYRPRFQGFPLGNGLTSRNVLATLPGRNPDVLVLGAHYDSKSPSPGANDNGTGVGALLQIAAQLRDQPLDVTLIFAFFGAEETIDSNPDHHHYGSRHYVASMSAAERSLTRAMISVDMIGYGTEFRVRTMGKGPQSLRDKLLAFAEKPGTAATAPLTYLRDPGRTGWSDHEAFELAGIPAAWLEWRDDPFYHTSKDTTAHLQPDRVQTAGSLVLEFARGVTVTALRFHDVAPEHPYRDAIEGLSAEGTVAGYADNTFRPANPLYRAQMAKMLVGISGGAVAESLVSTFPDLGPDRLDDLYPHDFVAAARRDGLIRGYADGRFGPWDDVTRAQAVTMVVRAAETTAPDTIDQPPAGYSSAWARTLGASEHGLNAAKAEVNGLLEGIPTTTAAADPYAPMARGEAAQLLWNLAHLIGSLAE